MWLGMTTGCTGGGGTNPPPTNKECESHNACWKKACTETDADAYQSCVKKQLGGDTGENPEYAVCGTDFKCSTLPTTDLGSGSVNVGFPEETKNKTAKEQLQWLRIFIFPAKDLEGKDITCERLKTMIDAKADALMSPELGRYYPPRTWTKSVTFDVGSVGDNIEVPYNKTVPQGSDHVFVVMGFCDPPEGRPDDNTKHKWWACSTGIATQSGEENTNVSMTIPVQNSDSCLP